MSDFDLYKFKTAVVERLINYSEKRFPDLDLTYSEMLDALLKEVGF